MGVIRANPWPKLFVSFRSRCVFSLPTDDCHLSTRRRSPAGDSDLLPRAVAEHARDGLDPAVARGVGRSESQLPQHARLRRASRSALPGFQCFAFLLLLKSQTQVSALAFANCASSCRVRKRTRRTARSRPTPPSSPLGRSYGRFLVSARGIRRCMLCWPRLYVVVTPQKCSPAEHCQLNTVHCGLTARADIGWSTSGAFVGAAIASACLLLSLLGSPPAESARQVAAATN